MLTPQEVSTHAFAKAVMGGYNMAMVDEFLDELTDDYTALYKENAALKAKMKVLVEKVEDYRATEDSMRATLLTAQKMADSIVHEAETKRDEILAQAQADAKARIGELHQEQEEAEERLRQICQQELELLERLPDLQVEVAAVPTEPAVEEEIEERVLSGFEQETAAQEQPAQAGETATEEPAAPVQDYPEGDPFSREETVSEPTRRINLNDLKFGRNYTTDGK